MVRNTKIVLLAGSLLAVTACAALAVDVAPNVQLHGYMQNRAYSAPGATTEFRNERVSLSATAALPEDSTAYAEVYYHSWAPNNGLYLESAYYDTKVADGRLRVGKGRRLAFGIVPAYGNRKTSNYGIVAEAFTQDRIQGVQYVYQKGTADIAGALQTGYRLGTRPAGEIPGDFTRNTNHQVPHLSFRDANAGGGSPGRLSRTPALSLRVGGKWANGFKGGVSGYFGSVDKDDVKNLTGAAGSDNTLRPTNPLTGTTPTSYLLPAGTTDQSMTVWGPDFTYKTKGGLLLQGELYDATVSKLGYTGYSLLAGFEPSAGWKFYARYGKQNMDVTPTDNPLSWDVKQVTLSAVQPLRKALWLQYEYEINTEDNGGRGDVKNDLFFVELFTGF